MTCGGRSTPPRCRARPSRDIVRRSDLAGHAGYGYCASHHHLVRAGQVMAGDKGFAGRDFGNFITAGLGAHLIRADRNHETSRFGARARQRQWIEAIFDSLRGQLTLEHHGGRTLAGVYARVAAHLLALAPRTGTLAHRRTRQAALACRH